MRGHGAGYLTEELEVAACCLQLFIYQFTDAAPSSSISPLQYFKLILCQQMPKKDLSCCVDAFLMHDSGRC